MHMSDALVSPPVFAVAGAISLTLLAIAVKKVKNSWNENIVPLMGVMGAFVFAAQMINFTIPGTGSSGHIVGGILLASVLGPWAAFITLASVIVIQCLVFADGGFMALGCNILNMGVFTCLIAYPLIYKPLMKQGASFGRILWVSILACVIGLELGAFAVTLETELSGITALPIGEFLLFMLPIHLVIGVGEGLATAAVVYVIQSYKPELLVNVRRTSPAKKYKLGKSLAVIAVVALLIGGSFTWIASEHPDGLEWSIQNLTGQTEVEVAHTDKIRQVSTDIQESTAVMPDYNTTLAGIIGSGGIIIAALGLSYVFRVGHKKQ